MNIKIGEAYITPNKWGQKRKSSHHIIKRILKAERGKGQVSYKGRPFRITQNFSTETMNSRRAWSEVMQCLRENKCQSRLLYPAKLSINIDIPGQNQIQTVSLY